MPPGLKNMILQKRGLILMVGATGSGKSTTLAAMINHRNEHQSGHILTIEDPIEFIHPNQRSIINQREVGQDTVSYERALKRSLREAPDRKSVVSGKSVSERVDVGGSRRIKQKQRAITREGVTKNKRS